MSSLGQPRRRVLGVGLLAEDGVEDAAVTAAVDITCGVRAGRALPAA